MKPGASCSYSNGDTTKERFMPKLVKKNDELGVFGAQKYFKGEMYEELLRTSDKGVHYHPNRRQEEHEEPCSLPRSKTASSVRSDSSWNSRRGLLVTNGNNQSKKISFKSLLGGLRCNCKDNDSVKIVEVKQPVKEGDLGQKTKSLTSRSWADDGNIRREDCFTLLVSNPSMADANPKAETIEVSRNGPNDTGSDASSDLFEIESFSTNN